MHSKLFGAYNETRETLVGLEIMAVESVFVDLDAVNDDHLVKQKSGFWLPTSKVADAATVLSVFDLLYLDEEDRVLERIEVSDSKSRANLLRLRGRAASALILAPGSISSTRTLIGDKLIFCVAEDMVRYLTKTRETV